MNDANNPPLPPLSPSDGERRSDRPGEGKSVERLFPFVLRTRILLVGRDTLRRSRSRLHFILITHDLSAKSREQIVRDFADYPIVQHYSEAELQNFFGVAGTKVVGFAKSGLAQSIYAELKSYRINKPAKPSPAAGNPESDSN